MDKKNTFKELQEIPDFPKNEEQILLFWEQIDAFKLQLEKTKNYPPFTFYDGPPFATGLPHYGNLLAGTIKDVVCRYASQNGKYVERRFGWDCHGLPIEYEIDKKLQIQTRQDVFKMGIDKYNAECRSIVMRYSKEWRSIVNRFGRWVDFDNDYKTLDLNFMESVWYVFKQMFEKGLIYRGCKVMPYSNGCNTVLSNFETQQNYKEVDDPALFVAFNTKNDPKTRLLAWTTTPWTLPSNLMLAVNKDFDYLKVLDKKTQDHYIIAECRIGTFYKDKSNYTIIEKLKGEKLSGIEYDPLFPYFEQRRQNGCFRVICADFVTSDTGTGIVHVAPGFGEDDYKICVKNSVIKPDDPPVPVDDNGYFTEEVADFKGVYVKDADKLIRKNLKERGYLLIDASVKHNYPYCWRSETPLIYKAVHCWFIKVTAIKEDLVQNNKKAYWVPKFAQEGRFNNWLQNASDWCFSRSRFWGNPIPIWVSSDFEEVVCIGSIEELKKLTGATEIKDLHRDFIDHLTIPSSQGKGVLRRVDEVFDCWFESGAMPYGQVHYPFSISEEDFNKRFPADFIGEGIDQTRGWFYTLNVISTAMRNQNPYKNLIVNGIVLADNGKKMSKSKKNYPDPVEVAQRHSADAIRLYMINSPLVRAEELSFKEEGVFAVKKDVFLPWYNAYKFLIQNITRWENQSGKKFQFDEKLSIDKNILKNPTDKWIIASCQNLINYVRIEMEKYHLYNVVPRLVTFLENLTNWYIRLNRQRIKDEEGQDDQLTAINVLFNVILNSTILMSPLVPFITESFYQNLVLAIPQDSHYYEKSVHLLRIPEPKQDLLDEKVEIDFERMQTIINSSRQIREKRKVSLKQPIKSLTIINSDKEFHDSLKDHIQYIEEEINTPSVNAELNVDKYVEYKSTPNHKILGQKLQKNYNKDVKQAVNVLNQEQIAQLQKKVLFKFWDINYNQKISQLKNNTRKMFLQKIQNQEEKTNIFYYWIYLKMKSLNKRELQENLLVEFRRLKKNADYRLMTILLFLQILLKHLNYKLLLMMIYKIQLKL
ncbi:isoleucine tRNA synthetase, putative [Ichthyophthirius multifiliis]|uniref:isoleucine--tRNA ligase n=1 Tax=Ichthyophthirius multifiliis TaxID=5932 RepID=G0QYE8_ICHMU|nr:isoleucine tRNA synthetase, putative [Ichthyophthirius multifiliis]EGR29757.1 isoleucine tRNA synthetase, putative [Ichthyophthirius multifiliis]|eukprot:XP_004030993.1 isoleucine tRNA synthetase, putative [Ichthyophthirius multifiliis]